jgi:hypothetical protein
LALLPSITFTILLLHWLIANLLCILRADDQCVLLARLADVRICIGKCRELGLGSVVLASAILEDISFSVCDMMLCEVRGVRAMQGLEAAAWGKGAVLHSDETT